MIELASRPGNRGAFLTQHVANGVAKTQRLNRIPQSTCCWSSELNPRARTNGPYPRCMSPANGCSAGTGRRWSPSDHSRKGAGFRILVGTVKRHRQAKCCQSNGLTFYRDGVLLTHDGRVFTITSRWKQPHLKASCRSRGDCAQSPPGLSVMSNSFAAVFHAAFHARAGQPERCPCIRLSHRLV